MVLLPLVAAHVDVPIVAAGGICDARSMAAAFVLGAEGVQMGTRLLASADSPVHSNLKQAVVGADETSTVLLPLDGKRMMRVIRTQAASLTSRRPPTSSKKCGSAAGRCWPPPRSDSGRRPASWDGC
jgi:enoyl-[acyl-carrier protein] reductase II